MHIRSGDVEVRFIFSFLSSWARFSVPFSALTYTFSLLAMAKTMTLQLATNRSLLYNKNRPSLPVGALRKLARTTATALMTTTFVCFQHTSGTAAGATAAWIASNDSRTQQSPIARVRKPTASHRLIRTYASFSESSSHPPSTSFLEQQMTKDALDIVHKAIHAVDPYTAVRNHFKVQDDGKTLCRGSSQMIPLDKYKEIVLVSFGKASAAMATAVLERLSQDRCDTTVRPSHHHHHHSIVGCVICKDGHATAYEQEIISNHYGIPIRCASHPIPDERSARAGQEILTLVRDTASPQTLVVCCISGGGSALFCTPASLLTVQDLQTTNTILLASGMTIQGINVIRKRLEEGKGGRLAVQSYPSRVITLVLSDVLGDPLDLIASGLLSLTLPHEQMLGL